MRFLIGVLAGIVLCAVIALGYLKFGRLPVAVSDSAWPFERAITHVALDARIDRDTKNLQPAVAANSDAYNAAVPVYVQQCAYCHGLPDKPSPLARHTYPGMPQLFNKHRDGVVGVSDDPPTETYWKIRNGIRLSGMPSYNGVMTEDQMWQVAQLLANADKLPANVQSKLTASEQTPASAATAAPAQ